MTMFSAKPGFALPAVLFIAVFGILLGFGRLLMFNNQCRLRLDRQQELEKVFAVRSALNCLQNYSVISDLPEEGGEDGLIVLNTDSGRETKVLIHPADAIFPVADDAHHFCIGLETATTKLTRYAGTNYRYASTDSNESVLKVMAVDSGNYCCMTPTNAGGICRLSLDMSDTGRWSDDPFGRRYAFNALSLCGGNNEHDTIRLILRRKRQDEIFPGQGVVWLEEKEKQDGGQSWRPSQVNESVIYAVLQTGGSDVGSFTAWTQHYPDPPVLCASHVVTNTVSSSGGFKQNSFGIQLVGRRLSLFQAQSPDGTFKQFNLAGTKQIPESVYCDFTNDVRAVIAGTTTLSTNLVMELEVVGSPSRGSAEWSGALSSGNEGESATAMNQFNHFEVYPAFEFAISIENKGERLRADQPAEPKLATVVHLEIDATRSPECTAISYDTHGTEIKGWRTDERKAWGVIR